MSVCSVEELVPLFASLVLFIYYLYFLLTLFEESKQYNWIIFSLDCFFYCLFFKLELGIWDIPGIQGTT